MTRRTSMQVSVEMILKAHGVLLQYRRAFKREHGEFYVLIEHGKDYFQDLVIQSGSALGSSGELVPCVAVAHLRRVDDGQLGEIQKDPEILFAYDGWEALEITQPVATIWFGSTPRVMGGYKAKYVKRDVRLFGRPGFKRDIGELVQMWAKELREQGFTDPEQAHVAGLLYQCSDLGCAVTDWGTADELPEGWCVREVDPISHVCGPCAQVATQEIVQKRMKF